MNDEKEEIRRIKQRIKQKNYRERKAKSGLKCVQLYLDTEAIEFLQRKIADTDFYNEDNLRQDNLDHIPVIEKTGYSDIISKILQDERHESDKIYGAKKDAITRNIKELKEEMIKEFLWKMEFSKLSKSDVINIIMKVDIEFII